MLRRLLMKTGSTPGGPPLDIPLSGVTVFVGPNNSGKSRALSEIEQWLRNANPPPGLVVKSVEFEPWSATAIKDILDILKIDPTDGESVGTNHVIIETLNAQTNAMFRSQINRQALEREAQNPGAYRNNYVTLLSLFTLKLDGKNRLALSESQPAGDLQKTAPNHLAKLFVANDLRARLRQIVFEAFVGMLSTIIAGNPRITLIDEPEAFLHPTLSARLGKEVAVAMGATDRRLFVSTHSASFLMGCILAGAPVNIVRLTYDYEVATARLLARDKLMPLMRHPLLRSVGVLNALFHSAVVVTESDADRSYYQEINERLVSANDIRGIPGCLFLNAQNKQTVWKIVKPLRGLGIPAAGIVDIDVLKEGGAVWKKPLEGAFIPELSHPGLQADRKALLDAFVASGKDMKRDGGLEILTEGGRETCRGLFAKLAAYGVFVVANDELKSW